MAQTESSAPVLRFRLHAFDHGYEATCDQLPFVRSYEDTAEEALDAVQDAAEFELARDDGMYDHDDA